MLRRERENRRRRLTGIVACVVLGVSLGVWHNRQADRGRGDFVTNTIRTVTTPLVNGVSGVSGWFGRQLGWLVRGRSLDLENRRLRAENDQLRQENSLLREADIRAERLRAQLGFPAAPPANKLAADVIAYRPNISFDTLVISRGSRDGVTLRSVVVAPGGLVGHVDDVGLTSSVVLLLTDSYSAVGAMVQRPQSRAVGVCKGSREPLLSMLYLARDADVKVGDAIVTSGRGGDKGIYPSGLPIGTVVEVKNDASGSTRHVSVKPAVDPSKLEEVYVLR